MTGFCAVWGRSRNVYMRVEAPKWKVEFTDTCITKKVQVENLKKEKAEVEGEVHGHLHPDIFNHFDFFIAYFFYVHYFITYFYYFIYV